VKQYHTLKKKNKGHFTLWLAVAVLAALELCSVSVLFSQMASYAPVQQRNYISLTEGGPNTTVEIGQRNADGTITPVSPGATNKAHYAPTKPTSFVRWDENSDKVGFWTYDKNTIWSTNTDIAIFRYQHDNNGDGVFTVVTSDGDKVFAPGTENDYSWSLKNTNTVGLNYIMTVEAYEVLPDGIYLPIDGRIYSHDDGTYLVGGPDEWPDVLEFDGVTQQGVISAGNIKDYTLQWRWIFERGEQIQEGLYKGDYTEDFYDTMLGNLALDEDLELHIIIRTSAWIDESNQPGGHPVTGDSFNPTMWIVIAAIAFVSLLFVVFLALKDRKQQTDED
jgi:hypothetical protein